MPTPALRTRARAKLRRQIKHAELEARARLTGGELVVDYGWGKLPYTGDGDVQEVLYHLNQARWHEKDENIFRSLLAPGQTAIDVGANSGFVTVILASIVGPGGRVLSFEPSPRVYAKLRRTVDVNELAQVTTVNMGCGATSSVAQLRQVNSSTGNGSIVAAGTDPIEIRIETLDSFAEVWEAPVALVKIDTEGYEPEVLRGATRLIDEQRPVLYLEMGGDYVESTRESIAILADAGYGVAHVRSIDWTRVGGGSDYFFLPRR
jgi:FkbM family methyltransferase